ncbi:MAG: D-alanyl-D-alanine dipeptidase [Rickettsiales bacterium]|nr:D-alanyl-D-alanine dipeptidase [Rickettsiales bacterium]
MDNLVKITEKSFGVLLDLRYATTNNVCGHKLYAESVCYLHQDAADLLRKAVFIAKKQGLKLKIFDGFRPIEVQRYMFNKFPSDDPHGGFISNPKDGAIPHCRGVAIDLTLVNIIDGKELDMGCDFDEFSSLAYHNCREISSLAAKNRLTLLNIMTEAGFDFYSKEWWHYQLFKPREYKVIETPQEMILVKNGL